MATSQFERAFEVASWLIDRLAGDKDLLRELMGGTQHNGRPIGFGYFSAMMTLEREAKPHGWARDDLEAALRLIQHN